MTKPLHPIAGGIALFVILSFWLSTALSELFAPAPVVVAVKTFIPWGLLILLPALAAAGISGIRLSRKRRGPAVAAKLRRMPVIAANGILVLVPAALFLATKAKAGEFDSAFFAVQALELAAGAVNITLMILNMRDGMRITGKVHRPG